MQLASARVGIGAGGPPIRAHEGGSQLALRKSLPQAGSTSHGTCLRPEERGAAWIEAKAL